MVEDNLDRAGDRDGKHQPDRAPYRSPEQQCDSHRQGIDFQAASKQLGIENIQSQKMHSDDTDNDDEQVSGLQLSEANQDRRHHRQHYSQIWNQAEKATEKADEIKERNMQQTENANAYGGNQQP